MTFKIALIGEAYGELEAQWNKPFIGPAGQELDRMLADAGITRGHCYVSNVFNLKPESNDVKSLCIPKTGGPSIPGYPALVTGKYVKQVYQTELDRLLVELEQVRPNIAVLLGNTASWALLKQTAISKIRGAVRSSPVLPWLKCLPTYHPAAVLRQYDLRHVAVLDLMKAARESEFPDVRIPEREIWLDPTLEDIERFYNEHALPCKTMAFDIETSGNQITCIGFAPSINVALVIPFHDPREPGASYWPDLATELKAWDWVQKLLDVPAEKVGQNTLYDIQYLWQAYGITVTNYAQDTMILHHSIQPESPKGLGFLGSVYTNNPAWKEDRPRGKSTIKRDDT